MAGWNRYIVHLSVLTLVVASTLVGISAPAHTTMNAQPPAAYNPPFPLVYPIDAPRQFADTFGTARDGGERLHQGGDLFAPKMAPVLATAAGRISAVDWSPSAGFYIDITHNGGWRSRYLHLNNDTPGTDDGLGFGIAEGIGVGTSVAAGQVIGYVGDSGNAESSSPHLHFELRTRDWTAVNPYPFVIGRSSETTLYVLPELSDEPVATGIEVLGHVDPGEGFNGDIQVHSDVAYLATIGVGEMCPASGVRMYRVVDSANPEGIGVIADDYEGTSTEQVWVGSIATDHFVGDIAVVAHRICEGAVPETFRGFTLYNVTDPANPVSLGSYETGPGTAGIEGFDVWVDNGRVVVAAAAPNSLLDHMRSIGDVRFVDISDPSNPADIVDWDFRRDADPVDRDTATDGADPRDLYTSDITLDPDGRRAFVSLWDAGVVVLDVSTIEQPRTLGWTGSLGHSEGKSRSTSFSSEVQILVVNHEDLDPLDDGEEPTSQSWGVQTVFDVGATDRPVYVTKYSVEDALPDSEGLVPLGGLYSVGDSLAEGRYAYSAWLTGGLRVVDLSNPLEPLEVASFLPPAAIDPHDRFVSPNGVIKLPLVWSVDVSAGVVYVSDINTGLWILRLIDAPRNAE
jgi:hypothetical protein